MTPLSLFTEPFTMPDGTTRRPLVERVPDPFYYANKMRFESDEVREALLIRAAHEWASVTHDGLVYDTDVENDVVSKLLRAFGQYAIASDLALACHLIADAKGVGQ